MKIKPYKNYQILTIFISFIIFFNGCHSGDNKIDRNITENSLNSTKKEIQSTIDSANFFFINIIQLYNNEPSERGHLKQVFRANAKKYELLVNESLNQINTLGLQEKLTNEEVSNWIKEFSINELKKNYDTADSLFKLH